jgi:two-component system, response regulator RegA
VSDGAEKKARTTAFGRDSVNLPRHMCCVVWRSERNIVITLTCPHYEEDELAQTRLPSILLVDDDCIAQQVFARQFGNGGWSVATAADCAQAARLFADNVLDCLVVERDLEDGSGFSLFDRLRAVNPRLSAIMITRRPSVAEAVRAIHAGFCDYRLKSLDCSDLLNPAVWRHEKGARELDELVKRTGSLARAEWNYIQKVLTHSRGNISEAARVLGLHRRSLQRKLRNCPSEDRRGTTVKPRNFT